MNKPFPRITARIRDERWAALPSVPQSILDTLRAHLHGVPVARVDSVAPASAPVAEKPANGIAIIPVHGIIGKHLSALETECGGRDVDAVGAAVDAAVDNPEVRAIVLDIASPGGTVTGVHETATKIREAAKRKPVYAFSSEQCCSAAYWLASACTAIYCAPTAVLGSIGVYVALVDDSEWFKREGYKLELIKAGEFKAAGISGKPLAEAERKLIQADVDGIYSLFVSDIKKRRPAVAEAAMQGQTFRGANAVSAKLADELVDNVQGVVVRALARAGAFKLPASSAQEADSTAKIFVGAPAPKDDADAWAIYQRLSGADRTAFYAAHEEAIWRGKREEALARRWASNHPHFRGPAPK